MTNDLHNLFASGAISSLPDGPLLERFVADRDGRAFEVLVRRHGPLVWGVCRRILADHHGAEDAFQATFLVLARRAGSIQPGAALAPWLYGVARRTATKARATAARHHAREQPITADPPAPLPKPLDLLPMLDQELDRLPERLRAAIILCELEGLTRREAANQLGWPEGTLASRLARGRALLAGRLTRRGFAVPLIPVLGSATPVPVALIVATSQAAGVLVSIGGALLGPDASNGLRAWPSWALPKSLVTLSLMLVATVGVGLAYRATVAGSPPQEPRPQVQPPGDPPRPVAVSGAAFPSFTRLVLNQALAALPEISDIQQRVWLLCEVARLQGQTGLLTDQVTTLQLAKAAASESESEHRLADVAEAFARAGDVPSALALVAPLRVNRDFGLDHLTTALAKAGDLSSAVRVAATIHQEPYQGEAWAAVALAQAERGDQAGALATVATITSPAGRASVWTQLALQEARAGNAHAVQTLNLARAAVAEIPATQGLDPVPTDQRPSAEVEVVGVLARLDRIDEARQVAQAITKAPWTDLAWVQIATAQAERGAIPAAMTTVESIRDASHRGEVWVAIVQAHLKQHDLGQARQVVERIKSPYERLRALLAVAQEQERQGQRTEAAATFQQARLGGASMPDQRPGSSNLRAGAASLIARAQGEIGDEAGALAWIDQPQPPLNRAWALLGLAQGMATRVPPVTTSTRASLDAAAIQQALAPAATGARVPTEPAIPLVTFRGKLTLFGVQRGSESLQSRIERLNPDGTGGESLLTLDVGQSIVAGRVAPDGQHLAYSVSPAKSDTAELWLMALDRTRRKLADNLHVVAWSPDSTRLVGFRPVPDHRGEFTQVILTIATGQEQVLPLPATDFVDDWSPTGETLAVMAGNRDQVFHHPTKGTYPLRHIYLWDVAAARAIPIPAPPMTDTIDARFAFDGQRLVAAQRRYVGDQVEQLALVQNFAGTTLGFIVDFKATYAGNREYRPDGPPCWAPDNHAVVWFVPRRKIESSTTYCELLFVGTQWGDDVQRRLDLNRLGIDWVQAVDWR